MATSSQIGGVETWLSRACPYLESQGIEVTVGLVEGLNTNSPKRFREYHPNLNAVEIDGRGLDADGRIRAVQRCIQKKRPDVVLPLGVVDAYEAVIRLKGKGQENRLIARTQGNLPPMFADLKRHRDWIDVAICDGHMTFRVLSEWAGFSTNQLRYLPNGADDPVRSRTTRQKDDPIRVGYVGRLSRSDKRCLDLLPFYNELTARDTPFTLQVVGDGPCQHEIESSLKHRKNVVLHGALSHEQVYDQIMPNLDVLVLFSSSESFGIVLPEAMKHGAVPVTSAYSSYYTEKIVLDQVTGMTFPVGDTTRAADIVSKLVADNAMLERLSKNAIAHARQYSWDMCLRKWKEAIENVVEHPARGIGERLSDPTNPVGSRLTRMGLPNFLVDQIRRSRRKLFGPAIPPGGEEWPLFHRNHQDSLLTEIDNVIIKIERQSLKEANRLHGEHQSESLHNGQ